MASLIAAISGDDTGSTQILIAHVNDTRSLLNGATAYLVKLIHNDANAFQIDPATSGYVATNAWFQLLDNADAEVLSIRYNGQIRSSLATGTAPFVVASTTTVANLSADTVDGIDTPATPTGALVTTTNTQTLTNKTLTAPTIADFTNAAHDHGDADDGAAVVAAALNLTATGDTPYRASDGTVGRLAIGAAGAIKHVVSGLPAWLAIGTALQRLRVNSGATALEYYTPSELTIARKASNEVVNNSSTLQNDDAILAAVSANTNYIFISYITYYAGGAADFKSTWTVPAGATITWGALYHLDATAALTWTGSDGAPVLANGRGVSTPNFMIYVGMVQVAGTAGNLQMQWAQVNATVEDATVLANSWVAIAPV